MGYIKNILFFAAITLSAISPAYGEVVQYFDQDGTLVITNIPHRVVKEPPRITHDVIRLNRIEGVYYDYYPVSGGNLDELLSSANRNGPVDGREQRAYPGQTRWMLGWSYKYGYSHAVEEDFLKISLNIFDVVFSAEITVVLPTISEDSNVEAIDMRHWNDFLRRLTEHEHDHVRIIKDPLYWDNAMRAITGIRGIVIPYEPDHDIEKAIKAAVETETAKIGHDLLKIIKQRNDEYDRLTEHGLKPELREAFFAQ